MVLTFEPVGEVLWCYNTSESCWAVLCCEAVYCTLNSDSNFWTYQWYPFKLLDVSINNGNWTEWSVIWSDGLVEIINSMISSWFSEMPVWSFEWQLFASFFHLLLMVLPVWTKFRISNIGFVPAWSLVPTEPSSLISFLKASGMSREIPHLIFQTRGGTATLPQPIWDNNDENLCQISDQWEKLKKKYLFQIFLCWCLAGFKGILLILHVTNVDWWRLVEVWIAIIP